MIGMELIAVNDQNVESLDVPLQMYFKQLRDASCFASFGQLTFKSSRKNDIGDFQIFEQEVSKVVGKDNSKHKRMIADDEDDVSNHTSVSEDVTQPSNQTTIMNSRLRRPLTREKRSDVSCPEHCKHFDYTP